MWPPTPSALGRVTFGGQLAPSDDRGLAALFPGPPGWALACSDPGGMQLKFRLDLPCELAKVGDGKSLLMSPTQALTSAPGEAAGHQAGPACWDRR